MFASKRDGANRPGVQGTSSGSDLPLAFVSWSLSGRAPVGVGGRRFATGSWGSDFMMRILASTLTSGSLTMRKETFVSFNQHQCFNMTPVEKGIRHSPGMPLGDGGFTSSTSSLGLGGLRLGLLLISSLLPWSSLSSGTVLAGGLSALVSASLSSSSEDELEEDEEDEEVLVSLPSSSTSCPATTSSSSSSSSSSELSSYSEDSELSPEESELAFEEAELSASARNEARE